MISALPQHFNSRLVRYLMAAALLALAAPAAPALAGDALLANPFGRAPASASASSGKQQARAALQPGAAGKAAPRHLERMLSAESNEFIVIFKDQAPARVAVTRDHAERLAMQRPAYQATRRRVRADLHSADIEFVHEYAAMPWAQVRVRSRAALVALMNHPDVQFLVENLKMKFGLAESLPLIHQPEAAAAGRIGAGVAVAVLDGGAEMNQPAFGDCSAGVGGACRIVAAVAMSTAEFKATPHGTNVAGIVAGVAPGAGIVSVDVSLGDDGVDVGSATRAIDWVITHRDDYHIVAVNMSFGTNLYAGVCDNSEIAGIAFSHAFARLRAAGIAPVVAAGNDASSGAVGMPACATGAIVVGATYDTDLPAPFTYFVAGGPLCTDITRNAGGIACFSNSSAQVSLYAPGAFITAAGYTMLGTSQAAPHVAGAIAVLRAPNAAPADSVDDTLARLLASGSQVTDVRNGVTKPRLDLLASLKGLIPDHQEYRLVCRSAAPGANGQPTPSCWRVPRRG
jgi:subtilisin family serine protease